MVRLLIRQRGRTYWAGCRAGTSRGGLVEHTLRKETTIVNARSHREPHVFVGSGEGDEICVRKNASKLLDICHSLKTCSAAKSLL